MCSTIIAATLDDADLASQTLALPLLDQLIYLSATLISALPDQACVEFCHQALQVWVLFSQSALPLQQKVLCAS